MPSISTDALLEYFVWMILFYVLPTFVSAALVSTVMNSERVRDLFESCIQIANLKVHEWMTSLENTARSSHMGASGTTRSTPH